jgi:hypothetical protein
VEGLKFLRRVFSAAPRTPSHRVVHEDGAEFEEDEAEDTSIPCPDCGAAVGVACDEGKPHRDEGLD